MIGVKNNYDYCCAIALLLTGMRPGFPQGVKAGMCDTLDALKRCNNIYDYSIIGPDASSPHQWLFHIVIQPNISIDYYDLFIRLTQDNECSYEVRHWPWGSYLHKYDAELLEFIRTSGWRNDLGQL